MYEIYCKIRDEMGLKDAQVSAHTGIARSTFADWKSGRSTPKIEKLQKIAEFLGVSIDYLLTGEQPADYYLTDETARAAQEIYDNADLRALFDAARDCPPEVLQSAAKLLKQFKDTNPDG